MLRFPAVFLGAPVSLLTSYSVHGSHLEDTPRLFQTPSHDCGIVCECDAFLAAGRVRRLPVAFLGLFGVQTPDLDSSENQIGLQKPGQGICPQ